MPHFEMMPIVDLSPGMFLYNNYKQALETIQELEKELSIFKANRNLTDMDLEQFLNEEKVYLSSLKKPRAANTLQVTYIEALEAWEDVQYILLL